MSRIAIIPARSGSKGLKDKNIKELNGIPLLAYTIRAAVDANVFDEIMVSTDSAEYAHIAQKYGASVPFLRSEMMSLDTTTSWEVVSEVLSMYRKMGKEFETVSLLQPTSPMRTFEHIKQAYNQYNDVKAKAVVSVCQVDHPVQWSFQLDESLSMESFAKSKYRNMRRQDIPISYRENGAIYIVNTSIIKGRDTDIYTDQCYAYVMSNQDSIDIDSELDFIVADYYERKKHSKYMEGTR